jgi:hypothetical protein
MDRILTYQATGMIIAQLDDTIANAPAREMTLPARPVWPGRCPAGGSAVQRP